jgi:hypothetical protein
MQALMNLVESEPKMFKENYKDLSDGVRKVIEKKMDFNGIKETAIESLVVMIERLPNFASKQTETLKEIFVSIFYYMVVTVEQPDEEWACPKEGSPYDL